VDRETIEGRSIRLIPPFCNKRSRQRNWNPSAGR
jgi:hypothetical protein